MLVGRLISKREITEEARFSYPGAWTKVQPGLPWPHLCFQLSSDLLVYRGLFWEARLGRHTFEPIHCMVTQAQGRGHRQPWLAGLGHSQTLNMRSPQGTKKVPSASILIFSPLCKGSWTPKDWTLILRLSRWTKPHKTFSTSVHTL